MSYMVYTNIYMTKASPPDPPLLNSARAGASFRKEALHLRAVVFKSDKETEQITCACRHAYMYR